MLPHELWELIIDELSSDRPALRACGLTQWAWVLPTRRHLYRELSLWRASVYGQKPFRPILSRSRAIGTGIAGCVRAVSLVGVHLYLGATAEDGDMGNTDIPALETILSELPNVARLRLIEVDFKASQEVLASHDPSLNHPIQSMFTLPRLEMLSLTECELRSALDTQSLLVSFPQISSLEVDTSRLVIDSNPEWPLPLPRNSTVTAMREVRLTGTRMYPEEMAFLFDVLRVSPFGLALQRLSWYPFTNCPIVLSRLLKEAESTLQTLEVGVHGSFDDMHLSRHSGLRSVRLDQYYREDHMPFIFQYRFLSSLPRLPSSLRVLCLSFVAIQLSPADLFEPRRIPFDWPSLDRALTALHVQIPLLVVYLCFYSLCRERAQPEDATLLSSHIPSALRAGLRVKVVVGFFRPGELPPLSNVVEEYWL